MDLVLGLAELLLFPTLLMLLVIATIPAERTLAPPAAPLPEDRRAVICSGAELARGGCGLRLYRLLEQAVQVEPTPWRSSSAAPHNRLPSGKRH